MQKKFTDQGREKKDNRKIMFRKITYIFDIVFKGFRPRSLRLLPCIASARCHIPRQIWPPNLRRTGCRTAEHQTITQCWHQAVPTFKILGQPWFNAAFVPGGGGGGCIVQAG